MTRNQINLLLVFAGVLTLLLAFNLLAPKRLPGRFVSLGERGRYLDTTTGEIWILQESAPESYFWKRASTPIVGG